jgi:hypothetical protein
MLAEHISEKKKQKKLLAQGSASEVVVGNSVYQEEGVVRGNQAWPDEKYGQHVERLGLVRENGDSQLPAYEQVMKT